MPRAPVRRTSNNWATASVLAILLAVGAVAEAGERLEETYDDGKRKSVYYVDAEGRRHGAYVGYHPNGKKSMAARYDHGVLRGKVTAWDEAGRKTRSGTYHDGRFSGSVLSYRGKSLAGEETWLEGILLQPRSEKQLRRELSILASQPIPASGPKGPPGEEEALRRLMEFRCLCGLPYADMRLDADLTVFTEEAVALFEVLGKHSHAPSNPGWPKDRYERGARGAARSNINRSPGRHRPLLEHMDVWMYDVPVPTVGHRVYCLQPKYRVAAFGLRGEYSALWVKDGSREGAPAPEYIAFPPRGLLPVSHVKPGMAWSVTLNSALFDIPSIDELTIRVLPVKGKPKSLAKLAAGKSLAVLDRTMGSIDHRSDHCHTIVFTPEDVSYTDGATYWVHIEGTRSTDGEPAPIRYMVYFVRGR